MAEDLEGMVLRTAEAAAILDCIVASEAIRDSENRVVDLRIVYLNGAGRSALAGSFGELVGRTWRELLSPERIEERLARWVRLVEKGGSEDARGLAGERIDAGS